MSVSELIETYALDDVAPRLVCMNPGCTYGTEYEPDQQKGWCEDAAPSRCVAPSSSPASSNPRSTNPSSTQRPALCRQGEAMSVATARRTSPARIRSVDHRPDDERYLSLDDLHAATRREGPPECRVRHRTRPAPSSCAGARLAGGAGSRSSTTSSGRTRPDPLEPRPARDGRGAHPGEVAPRDRDRSRRSRLRGPCLEPRAPAPSRHPAGCGS